MTTTLITNGTIVSATGRSSGDVLIDGETIVGILAPGQAAGLGIVADDVIDATGKYVIPGGIDAHTHMELPFGGTAASDTFETGTIAARVGRHHDDRRLRGADAGQRRAGRPRHVAREGGRQLRRSTTRSTRSSAASTRSR